MQKTLQKRHWEAILPKCRKTENILSHFEDLTVLLIWWVGSLHTEPSLISHCTPKYSHYIPGSTWHRPETRVNRVRVAFGFSNLFNPTAGWRYSFLRLPCSLLQCRICSGGRSDAIPPSWSRGLGSGSHLTTFLYEGVPAGRSPALHALLLLLLSYLGIRVVLLCCFLHFITFTDCTAVKSKNEKKGKCEVLRATGGKVEQSLRKYMLIHKTF